MNWRAVFQAFGVSFMFWSLTLSWYSFAEKEGLEAELACAIENAKNIAESRKLLENKIEQIQQTPTWTPRFEEKSFQGEVYDYMKLKLAQPEAALALASHESDRFRSKFFKASYNMFCMKYTSGRTCDFKIFNKGDGHYKLGFKDWRGAVDDMASWEQRMTKRGLDLSDPIAYIKSLRKIGYATDPYHGTKVLHHFNTLFDKTKIEHVLATL